MSKIGKASKVLTAIWRAELLLATAGFITFQPANAHAEYPDRPVTIVSCFPAGGGTDVAVRTINTQLGQALGMPASDR